VLAFLTDLAGDYGGPAAVAVILALTVVVVLVALFGSEYYSERAMRILHCQPRVSISPPNQPGSLPRSRQKRPALPPAQRTSNDQAAPGERC
jgi:hypothetical protein